MALENPSLVLDLVEWIARGPRRHSEVMEAWRTSCPRLTVWEDALDQGYVVRHHDTSAETMVEVTEAGRAFLQRAGRLTSL